MLLSSEALVLCMQKPVCDCGKLACLDCLVKPFHAHVLQRPPSFFLPSLIQNLCRLLQTKPIDEFYSKPPFDHSWPSSEALLRAKDDCVQVEHAGASGIFQVMHSSVSMPQLLEASSLVDTAFFVSLAARAGSQSSATSCKGPFRTCTKSCNSRRQRSGALFQAKV